MMIEPSIDLLVEKTDGNRYVLCNLISKRAKNIESVRGSELADKDQKSISVACEEIVAGKVIPSEIEKKSDSSAF